MPATAAERIVFALVLLGYVVAGALYAINTPAWQAPDEPAHYNAIRQVAESGCCPLIEAGDWQGDYLAQLTSAKFAPELLDRLGELQYEDHHPPLYYLLASLVYKLSAGDLIALRLLSVALGAAPVGLSYFVARPLAPRQPQVALATMALVAFIPQHLHMLASVNNDALAEALVALALLVIVRYWRATTDPGPGPLRDASGSSSAGIGYAFGLGLIVGGAFMTKLTIYFLAPLCALSIWLRWRGRGNQRELARQMLVFALVAGAIGGVWWLRNIAVYGFPDFLGLGAHDAVVQDQLRTADYVAQHGFATTLTNALSTLFKSFVGQFGWMALPLDEVLGGWIYRGFGLFALIGLAGTLLSVRDIRAKPAPSGVREGRRAQATLIMLVSVLLVSLQVAYYNLEFVQWQGRYLYPALIPIAVALVGGWELWRGRLLGRWQGSAWLLPLALMCLPALDLYLLFRVIVPGLAP